MTATQKNSPLRPLIIRTVIFVCLFMLVTGILGPWIISTPLLYQFSFFIYPNIGKVLIISFIVLLLLARQRVSTIHLPRYNNRDVLYVVSAIICVPLFFLLAQQLIPYKTFSNQPLLSMATHLIAVSIPLLLLSGVFGIATLRYLVQQFKKELMVGCAVGIFAYFSIFQVWKLWEYFSAVVLQAVYFLFSLTFSDVRIIPPRGLFVESFAVSIEQACSGVDSLFLFSILYIVIAIIDWHKLNHWRVILAYIPLATGLFFVNILRVYILILIGVLISPKLTLQLFHTYMGMILFIVYFFAFIQWMYPYLFLHTPKKVLH